MGRGLKRKLGEEPFPVIADSRKGVVKPISCKRSRGKVINSKVPPLVVAGALSNYRIEVRRINSNEKSSPKYERIVLPPPDDDSLLFPTIIQLPSEKSSTEGGEIGGVHLLGLKRKKKPTSKVSAKKIPTLNYHNSRPKSEHNSKYLGKIGEYSVNSTVMSPRMFNKDTVSTKDKGKQKNFARPSFYPDGDTRPIRVNDCDYRSQFKQEGLPNQDLPMNNNESFPQEMDSSQYVLKSCKFMDYQYYQGAAGEHDRVHDAHVSTLSTSCDYKEETSLPYDATKDDNLSAIWSLSPHDCLAPSSRLRGGSLRPESRNNCTNPSGDSVTNEDCFTPGFNNFILTEHCCIRVYALKASGDESQKLGESNISPSVNVKVGIPLTGLVFVV